MSRPPMTTAASCSSSASTCPFMRTEFLKWILWWLIAVILLLALSLRGQAQEAQVDSGTLQEAGTTKGRRCAPFKLNFSGCNVSKSGGPYVITCAVHVVAGFTATANANFSYSTTNQNWHAWNGSDRLIGLIYSGTACAQHSVNGNKVELTSRFCCGTASNPGGDPNSIQFSNGGISFSGITNPLTTRRFVVQSCNGSAPSAPSFDVLRYGEGVSAFSSEGCSGYPIWDETCDTPSVGSSTVENGSSVGQLPVRDAGSGKYKSQTPLVVVDVKKFSGADWCAQVNAADTAYSGRRAILSVTSAMSGLTACTTSISLSSGHQLQFGAGLFDVGVQSRRAGIVIGHAINNIDIGGAGRAVTTLYYTSHNVGVGNGFPWGSAIGIGTVGTCTGVSDAANGIRIHDIRFIDRNTGSALASAHNPSAIDGACTTDVTIENNQFTDIKGNGAITVTGNWGSFTGATNYFDRNNIFDGTIAGGGAELNADNSANWNNYYVLNNTISYYPCGIGVSHAFQGIVSGNKLDMTLKSAWGSCPAIGLGSGEATVGYLQATNNIILLGTGSAPVGIGMYPKANSTGNFEMGVIGNIIRQVSGSSITGISINGALAGQSPPSMIVRHNTVTANYPTAVAGVLGNIEVSDNDFEGASDNIDIFNCASAAASIQSGSVVRVFNNRRPGNGGVALRSCTNSTFASRRFQEWNNTQGAGDPSAYYGGYVGQPARVIWRPGIIAAGSSTSTQTTTVNGAIVGDEVKIILGSSTTTLPVGVFATGYVSASNTVSWKIVNTTTSPITINGGGQITTYVSVDRPPNNSFVPDFTNIKAANTAAPMRQTALRFRSTDRKSSPPI